MTPDAAALLNARTARECMGWREAEGDWLEADGSSAGYLAAPKAPESWGMAYWDPLHSPACREVLRERLLDLGWMVLEEAEGICFEERMNRHYTVTLNKRWPETDCPFVVEAESAGAALVRVALLAVTPAPIAR